jgi:hypothetical protein
MSHAPTTPDVEAIAYAALKDLGGITLWAYDSQLPWPQVEDVVGIQVDVRASSKKRARDRAYEARQRLVRLPFDPTSLVGRCDVEMGPMWAPDEDGAPRYVIRTSIAVRAMRGIG